MTLKKFFKIISSLVLVLTLIGNITYAYSLDDVKQDYKKVKIKKHSGVTDAGRKINWREGKIMKLQTPTNGNLTVLTFYLYELPNSKYVDVELYHNNPRYAFWDRLTLGDGKRAYDVLPATIPKRGSDGAGWIVEKLTFRINNRTDFFKWKNAVQIRAKGQNYYTDFVIKKEYPDVMRVIEKFLFE